MCLRWRGAIRCRGRALVLLNSIVQDIIIFALGPHVLHLDSNKPTPPPTPSSEALRPGAPLHSLGLPMFQDHERICLLADVSDTSSDEDGDDEERTICGQVDIVSGPARPRHRKGEEEHAWKDAGQGIWEDVGGGEGVDEPRACGRDRCDYPREPHPADIHRERVALTPSSLKTKPTVWVLLVRFLLILVPSGPSAPLVLSVAQQANAEEPVGDFLIVVYLRAPLMTFLYSVGMTIVHECAVM
ncbi:hypothetical protein FIBSPDRAFT_926191 [Athelia psychrophila]|uniref:Uncharacterized protein n=1 Tax=Athelia psychrophila TaxID=1759441 RepID=A0A166TKF3_9AGAM|nr:hypothetical protein FIBSPDRAFT_926191 [Fibularhizoctonia sp. CBS 109695]